MAPSPADLTVLRDLLVADRTRTTARIADHTQNFTSIVEASRLTATDDEHDPEGSTIAFERSQASALVDSAGSHLAEVDLALVRIDDGTYGRCERCDRPIALDRLMARPSARVCIDCASGVS